jgi:RNA polymerase sigma factor (TIGR02999 family)
MTTRPADDGPTPIDRLLPAAYREVRAVAAAYLRRERPDHTLQPTALVHEAYLKLQRAGVSPAGRAHLLALAASAMRQILVDHARARAARKRGGGWQRVTVDSAVAFSRDGVEDVLAVHEALVRLATVDARAARVVEMRFFGGLTEVEIAEEMGISERWVREQWSHARAWLRRELANGNGGG